MARQMSGTTPKHELELTAAKVREFWAARGVNVTVWVVSVQTARGTIYEIKSTGIPVRGI